MKKAIKVSKKALSVTLALLMVFTSWVWFAPDKAEAAEGNKYYVKVYVNIYDGSDGYGGAYAVEETTGKPKNYSWATNDGWYGRINMTGFTVFGEKGDYDAQDVSAALLEAEKLDTYYDMSGLSNDNASGDWDSKAIAKTEYTFVLDSFPVEIFWINDENNWDGGNTGFAIRKLTVATSENGTEHTMWEGLAGSDSETYNYYGSITPTGIHTCFEDYAKNYDMNDYKFYKSITTSSQRAWTDPYTYGSAGTYYLNEYANGGVSATFSEGTTSVASTVDYIDTSSTDTYYVNYTNHSKTQIAEITGTYNGGNFVTSPYGIKLNPGETRSFEINKSKYSRLAKYNNAANFTFEYTLSNVYASDEINASLAKFIQPTYIGLWNENSDSPKYITDEDGDGSTGYTLKISDNYDWGDNSMTMTNTFQTTEGIIERNSATTGSGSNSVTFNYNYYVDVSNISTWEDTGLRIYVTEDEYYRLPFQPKEYPSECGTITLSGNYANTGAASITIADIAFTNVTEDFWYSHSQASGYSTYGYYNQKGTPMWATQGKDAQATFYNNNPGWLRFAGTMIETSADSADPAKIVMDKMVYRENQNGQKAYFSGTINVYAFDKAELRDYIQKTLLDLAPMSLRYNTTAFETYQNKLAAAMNVLADQKTTQKAVATALSELKSAVAALQSTDNLINQVAELTHIQYVDDIGSEVAASTDERYVLVTLGEHTVPQKTEYIGNGEYKNATNKNSDLKTNYSKTDTNINIINYRYWNIDYSAIDGTIADLETAINNFDDTAYKKSFKTDLENAKANLEAMKATVGVINTPTSQEDIDVLIINAENLITHLGKNMRVHQWIEDADGNYVAEMDKDTHWYTCKICGYELVYDHTFAYENLGAAQHKVTCVTNDETFVEGCGYTFNEDHVWVEGETVATSCTEGNTSYSCICGATKTEATTVSNHKFAIADNGDGTHIRKCSECGVNEPDAVAEAHTLSYVNNNDGTHTATCSVCSATETVAHTFANPVLTQRPTQNDDGTWNNGTYTSTCNCGATDTTEAERADYKAYDKAVADLNALLANEKLTDAAKTEISNVLAANDIADNYTATAEEQKIVDDAAAALNVVLGELTDNEGNLKDEYEKVDFTGYNAAVNASESLKDVMTDADKAAVVAEMQKVTDAGINAETSKADGQATLDKAAAAIAAINAKYGDCAEGNHTDADNDGNHNCDTCGKADVTAHNYADATCTAPKTCTECGATDGEALEHEDTDNDHICNNGCNDKISDCSDVTTDNDHNCDICGAENVTDHDYEYNVVVTTPTCTTGGLTTKTCNCGHSITVDVVPANGHSWSEPSALYEDDSTGKFGYYNYVCGSCGESVNVYVERADYTVYDSLVKAYEDIVNDSELWDSLTDETVSALSNVKIKLDEIPLIYTAKSTDEETKIVTPDGQAELDASIAGIIIDLEKIQQSIESGSGLRLDASEFEKVVSEYEGDPFDGIDATCDIVSAEDAEYVNNIINETRVFVSENLDKSSASDEQKQIDAATEDIRKIIEKYAYCLEHGHVWGEWVENIVLDSENNFVSATYSRTCDKCGKVDTYYAYLEDYSEYDTAVENATNLLDNEKLTDAAKDIISEAITNAEKLDQNLPGDIIAGWDDEGNEIKIDVNENAETIKGYTDALNDVINSLYDENGNLKDEYEKPDYTAYNAAVNAFNGLADVMNATDKAEVERIKAEIAGIPADGTKAQYQTQIDKAAADIAAINAKYGDCADGNHVWGEPVLTTDPTETTQGEYTETCKTCGTTQITKVDLADYDEFNTVVGQLEDLLDTENLTDEAKTAIENALAKAEALDKNLPDDATTVDGKLIEGGQDEIDALVTELNSVVANTNASISDGSALKPDYEAWKEAEGAYDALDKKNVKDEIKAEADALKAEIAEKQDDDTLTQATATQDDIDDATARLNEIIAGINDGTLIKDADFTEVDKDLADAKDKAENNNVVDSVKDKIDEIEEKLEALEGANADKQGEIDTLEDQLEDIIAGITDGSLVKPDYDAWDEAESTYDELDKTNVNSNIIAEADALKAEIAEKQADDTLTQATATQKDINDAIARLNEIITGINNGTLKNPADFTEVNKDLAEAKDKAENNNVVDSVKDKIDEIEEKLEALEGANADKQGEIDTLEDQLEDIIAGITDGSLVKPDYSGADDVIGKAENDIDNGGKLSEEDKAALEELKKNLDEIKNDPTSNKKYDQSAVDSIKDSVQSIINKYSGCAEGNHNYVAKVVEPGCETTGYTEHKCTVCGKAYRDNLKPATGHSVITVPAMDATCSEEGRTEGKICENCGKIFVEIEVIPRLPHTDEDEDGVCDICGASDLYAGCACLCHNKHWFWHIIYLIVRIIWRVFGIHQYCACGFVHFK